MKMHSVDHSPIKKQNVDISPPTEIIDSILEMKKFLLQLSPGLYNDVGAKLNLITLDKRSACKTYR